MKYLLDTSALCSHFLGQQGGTATGAILESRAHETLLCVISWFEFRCVMRRCGVSAGDVNRAVGLYREIPIRSCDVDAAVVDRAVSVRDATGGRLPLADALIAACAAVHDAVLVHRDPHYDAIPVSVLKTMNLAKRDGNSV